MPTEKYKIYLPYEMKKSLTNDAELFEFYKLNGRVNLNGFLKTMLVNYFEVYAVQKNKLHSDVVAEIILFTDVDEAQAEELATSIIALYMDNVSETYGKSDTITLTVSGKSYDILGLIEHNLNGNYSLSQYVRTLISSYLSSSRSTRERIIFSDQYNEILTAIKEKRTISFSTTSSGEQKYLVAPYALIPSKEEQYNYLLCYDIEKQMVRSFRLSRIRRLLIRTNTFQLDTVTLEKLKKAEKKRPQFAFEESMRVNVKLTEKGFRKFKMIYTNRPEVIEINGNILTFEWPLMQLEEYFKRFGKEAEIIEPVSARQYMLEFYKEAYTHYSQKNDQ